MASHPVAVAADVDDVAVMDQPVDQALAMTSSPKTSPQSSKPLLLVSTVEACS